METEKTFGEYDAPFHVLDGGYRECRYCHKRWHIDGRECNQLLWWEGKSYSAVKIDRIGERGRRYKQSVVVETICPCINREQARLERDIEQMRRQELFNDIDGALKIKRQKQEDDTPY